jgi:drug/metabolite transporter (DMT)-like permease
VKRLRDNATTFLIPGIVAFGLFWAVAPFVPRNIVYAVVNALALSIGVGIVIAYSREIWETIRLPRSEVGGGHILVLGIVLAWLSSAERGAFSYIYRYLGEPPEMMSTLFQAFAVWVLFWAGVLHLTAKGAIHGKIPRRNWVRVGIVVCVAMILALIGAVIIVPPEDSSAGGELLRTVRGPVAALTVEPAW